MALPRCCSRASPTVACTLPTRDLEGRMHRCEGTDQEGLAWVVSIGHLSQAHEWKIPANDNPEIDLRRMGTASCNCKGSANTRHTCALQVPARGSRYCNDKVVVWLHSLTMNMGASFTPSADAAIKLGASFSAARSAADRSIPRFAVPHNEIARLPCNPIAYDARHRSNAASPDLPKRGPNVAFPWQSAPRAQGVLHRSIQTGLLLGGGGVHQRRRGNFLCPGVSKSK